MIGKKRICIAEDHTILRAGLRALLASHPEVEIVAEAADGLELLSAVQKHHPDLVLLDLSMPRLHGLEAIKEIKQRNPQIRIVVLTMHDTEEYVLAALQGGAEGYVLKENTEGELMLAVNAVLAGKTYLSPEISGKIVSSYLVGKKTAAPTSHWETLTHRERQILKLIAEGYKNKEIAESLHMSVKTVETHRMHLMKKLDLHSAAALTAYASEKGLL
ncbi:MAG TPA: response regulator transcription factor [Methylococcaceae bacterium]|nr:response regulator transcription factor [Methylococcaceae bacterium]